MASSAGTLNARDIIEIISACRKNGVGHFDFNGLTLRFLEMPPEETKLFEPDDPEAVRARFEHDLKFNEAQTREEELENLRLSNPLEYEELIARQELADA